MKLLIQPLHALLCAIVLRTQGTASAFVLEGGVQQAYGGLETSLPLNGQYQDTEGEFESHERRAVLTAAATALLTTTAPMAAVAGDDTASTTLHIVGYPKEGQCGQADVPSAGVFFAKNLGGMIDGPCSKDGYAVPEGTANGIKEKDKERIYEIYGKE